MMVRKERLELSRLAALEPKSSASTNFATFACVCCYTFAKSIIVSQLYQFEKQNLAIITIHDCAH
jgi:hypothetical protein